MTLHARVLLVSGSLRGASINTAVLRTAASVVPEGVQAAVYHGLGLLPHFNPDDDVDPRSPVVVELREQIRAADAMMFSVPEYAGALPGSFKNLLDWTIGDDQPGSIYEKPVGWINASSRGAFNSHDELRRVLDYAHATIVATACVGVPVTGSMVGDDGLIAGLTVRARIGEALTSLAAHAGRADDQHADPPVACELGTNEGLSRMRRWEALGQTGHPRAHRSGRTLGVRYRSAPGVREELLALVAAERQCCSFVSWHVDQTGPDLVLHVTADPATPDDVAPIAALFGVH